MINKCAIFEREDGTITLRYPNYNGIPGSPEGKKEQETDQEWFDRLIEKDKAPVKGGVYKGVVNISDLPKGHQTFKEARRLSSGKITVDMPNARKMHMEKIRKARAEKFLEMGFPSKIDPDLEASIVSQKKRAQLKKLRDIPQTFKLDGAKTPEDLKKLWPNELKENERNG